MQACSIQRYFEGYFSHSSNFIGVADEYCQFGHSDCFRNQNFSVSATSTPVGMCQSSTYLDGSSVVGFALLRSARWPGLSLRCSLDSLLFVIDDVGFGHRSRPSLSDIGFASVNVNSDC